jgi:2-polyprenyl-6-methoxyphenol hydroxylase-like FAD-dependent oxidoreductase
MPSSPTRASSAADRPPPLKVAILGGGIGGLTLANALLRFGLDFDLYEQAPELTEVGAGIGLSRGALELLDMLGVGEEARRRGSPIRAIHLADRMLNLRRTLPANYSGVCIHRPALIDLLKERLPTDRIHLSHQAIRVRTSRQRVSIDFAQGGSIEAACAVAADGIHSVARRAIFPGIPVRYIRQTIWRGISSAEVPEMLRTSYVEVWDERLRFLTVPIGNDETFWLGVKPAPPGERDDPATVRDELLTLFGNFHPAFLELIRTSRNVLRDDMADLGPPGGRPWHQHRLAFLGDAIHATTPNLAQGGCQAMEDAVCLALCLAERPDDPEAAYGAYTALRRPKAAFVVNTSWRFGVAAHSESRLHRRLGRLVLERTPAWLVARQERFLSDVGYLRGMAGRLDDAAEGALAGRRRG